MQFITRSSTAVHSIITDVLKGTASVMFNDGRTYLYKNVSRRAILNLNMQPNMSLGFWINANCVDNPRVSYKYSYAIR